MKRGGYVGVCVALLAWTGSAAGRTFHVGGKGARASIQAALDAAASGDRIEVAPGTYPEAVDFRGKPLRLYSRGGPDVTVIDGTGHDHVVQCISGEGRGTILEGFTITGGNTDGAEWGGGGMLNLHSSPTVTNCRFDGSGNGMENWEGSPIVTDCTFTGSRMYSYLTSLTVSGCTFDAATGNALVNAQWTDAVVTDCTFTDNGGAGMINTSNSTVTVSRCTFTGNSVGMLNDDNYAVVSECTFSGNAGDGIQNYDFGGGPVNKCTFIDNAGRGMYNFRSGPAVTNCTFIDNAGGGIYNQEPPGPTVTNCIFIDNAGAGMHNAYTGDGHEPIVTHCTFIDNAGGGIYNVYSDPNVTNCILWSNSDFQIGGNPGVVTWSDIQDGWAGEGNIDADPLFLNADDGDYHLAPGSPCVDAGTNDPAGGLPDTDLDGNPRCVDGDGDRVPVADMGAYEASGKKPTAGKTR